MLSSALGLPALHALATQGAVVGVGVPRLPQAPDEADQLAQTAASLGLPVRRLERAGLAVALADVCVCWEKLALAIDRLVRATNPWNSGAPATLRGQPLRLLVTTPHPTATTGPVPPGPVLQAEAATGLWMACGPGEAIRLDVLALDEGYFTGGQLVALDIGAGEVLGHFALLND